MLLHTGVLDGMNVVPRSFMHMGAILETWQFRGGSLVEEAGDIQSGGFGEQFLLRYNK